MEKSTRRPEVDAKREGHRLTRSVQYVMIVMTLFVVVLMAATIWISFQAHKRTASEATRATAYVLSENLRISLDSVESVLLSIAEQLEGQALPDEEIHQLLMRRRRSTPTLRALYVAGPDGKVIAGSRAGNPSRGIAIDDRDYFRIHAEGVHQALYINEPVVSRADGGWALPVSVAARHPDGSLAYLVFATLEPLYFEGVLAALEPGMVDCGYLARRDGTVLSVFPHQAIEIGTSIADTPVFAEQLSSATEGVFAGALLPNHPRGMVAFRGVNGLPLVVALSQNLERAYGHFYRDLLGSIVVFAIMLSMLVIASRYQLRQAYRVERQSSELAATSDELREINDQLVRHVGQIKETQQALRESEGKLRLILERNPAAIAMFDRDLRILVATERWHTGIGCINGDVVDKSLEESLPAETYARWLQPLQRALRGEVVTCEEEELARPDGRSEWVHWAMYPWHRGDGDVGGVIVFVDFITRRKNVEEERRRLEEQVRQAQKMESLGVLAGGIAHDFNNLLTGVLGNVDLALTDIAPTSPIREMLLSIQKASHRAAELCRQMLAYSGRGRFVIEPVDVNEVIEEMQTLLEMSISKSAVLKFHLAEDLPAIEADITQIRQVVMNLITNASDAIGNKSGVITVVTGSMTCDGDYLDRTWLNEDLGEGDYVYLEVSDTGCGMDEETLSRIFDPFFTTKFTGRGLGLAAVLGIMRGHRGAIKVYSEPGRGTTFKCLFPALAQPAATLREQRTLSSWKGTGTVLLVDDEEMVRSVGRKMLERAGFTVMLANDGREAVEVYRRHHANIACVLLDLTMPHMDGERAYREMRRIRQDVRVVLSSGYNEQEVSARFIGKKLAGFIQKPYQVETLVEVLRQALGETCVADPNIEEDGDGTDGR